MIDINTSGTLIPILRGLVDISKKAQSEMSKEKSGMSPRSWLNSFCTVQMKTARRTGHTIAGLALANDEMSGRVMFVKCDGVE